MFQKGNKITRKGIKNDEKLMSVKKLLEDAFIRRRSDAIAHIDAMMQDRNEFKYLLSLKASVEPRPVAPTLVINNEGDKHTHITSVQLNQMSDHELIDFLTGRKHGLTPQPAWSS